MAFDVTNAETVVSQHAKELATKAVAGAKTAKLLIDNKSVTPGVKGSAKINKMNAGTSFQSGASCGRTASGSVTLTDKSVTVTPIKDIQDICPKALYDTYYANLIGAGQDPEGEDLDSTFINGIMDFRASKIAEQVEIMLWQGDTAATTDNTLKWIDGFLKQITAASDEIALTPGTGTMISQLQAAYKGMPVKVRKQSDFRLFIGEDAYDAYLIELDAANKFRETSAFTLTGTTAQLEVTPGLNGTNKVVAARISDLHLGIDGIGDEDKATLKYSMETEQWYADFHFAVGVTPVFTDQIGIGALVIA
jgi:hypothetical protein